MDIKRVNKTEMLLIYQLDLRFVEWVLDLANAAYKLKKRQIIEQILDKLDSFCNHTMTEIQILFDAYYAFFRQIDSTDNVIKLLEKDKFLFNNIENMSNKKHHYRSFNTYKLINYI